MASKNKNPYRKDSAYSNAFDVLRSAGQKGVTRSELLEAGHAVADVTVVLSPRQEGSSTRGGDCRGNGSSQGHLYFIDKRKKKGEVARFVLRWRKTPLDKKVRPPKVKVASQKATPKAKAKKAKVKTADPVTA